MESGARVTKIEITGIPDYLKAGIYSLSLKEIVEEPGTGQTIARYEYQPFDLKNDAMLKIIKEDLRDV